MTNGGRMDLDRLDSEILNRIQADFPLCLDPYEAIGKDAGISPEEAYARVMGLISRGVIRKIGPFFDAKKMGFRSTLCAVDVPQEKLGLAASVINSFPEVTHNYLREGSPNVWFTVIAPSDTDIERILEDISQRGAVGPIRNLPAQKTFKVKVDLRVGR